MEEARETKPCGIHALFVTRILWRFSHDFDPSSESQAGFIAGSSQGITSFPRTPKSSIGDPL